MLSPEAMHPWLQKEECLTDFYAFKRKKHASCKENSKYECFMCEALKRLGIARVNKTRVTMVAGARGSTACMV